LLVSRGGQLEDLRFTDLPEALPPYAHLIFNNTRVVHARMQALTAEGKAVEIFFLGPLQGQPVEQLLLATHEARILALVGRSKRWKSGLLQLPGTDLTIERGAATEGAWELTFRWKSGKTLAHLLLEHGEIPLPPYLNRKADASDADRYQTIFAQWEGSVAAPTASLHFTEAVLKNLDNHGFSRSTITLHVGAGTFKPVSAAEAADHAMHSEALSVEKSTLQQWAALPAETQWIPVGTTAMRTMESLFCLGEQLARMGQLPTQPAVQQWDGWQPRTGLSWQQHVQNLIQWLEDQKLDSISAATALMIGPGYERGVTHGIITNFHQPKSTLLLLIAQVVGPHWKHIYNHALNKGYRFLSYGDSSLLLP
jgi:S-adenosylmethionine:tRNA ribosyltransferase-isomerase